MLTNNNLSAWIASKSVEDGDKIFQSARSLVPVKEALAKSCLSSIREFNAHQMKA